MTDDLRTRIAAIHQAHRWGVFRCGDGYARTCCRCQWRELSDGPTHAEHVADAVIRELTEVIPPIVATAIQSYAQSELAAMSYHGGSRDAFEAMEKMNGEAAQIARYATTHEDWNG